jgi:hypothetical protein
MTRHLFNLAAAVSLVLCVAAAVVWVRSRRTFDDLCRAESRTCINVVSVSGQLHLQFAFADGALWSHVRQWDALPRTSVRYSSGPYTWQVAGFATGYRAPHPFGSVSAWEHVVVLPYWALLALFGALPGAWLRRLRGERVRRARREHGRCERCGYDLRASPQRCPECGTPAARIKPQPAEGLAA